jgi:hypothetical protein
VAEKRISRRLVQRPRTFPAFKNLGMNVVASVPIVWHHDHVLLLGLHYMQNMAKKKAAAVLVDLDRILI